MTREELTDFILGVLREDVLRGADSLTAHSDLISSGLESLGLTQLLLAIEEATGLWVDEGLLTEETLATAATLASLVHGQLERS